MGTKRIKLFNLAFLFVFGMVLGLAPAGEARVSLAERIRAQRRTPSNGPSLPEGICLAHVPARPLIAEAGNRALPDTMLPED